MHPRNLAKSCYSICLIVLAVWSSASIADETEHWAVHDSTSKAVVNHKPMSQILGLINVEERNKNLIAYSRLSGRALEYAAAYVAYLESIPVSTLNRDEQLAYWLNLHNVSVIKLIAENRNGHKKVKSYRGTPAKPGDKWLDKNLVVEERTLSLQDIEQNILLTQWQNPNVIYGISYGVQGSPVFGKAAFNGNTVQQQLENRAKSFINSPKNVASKRKGLEVSSLYDWHKTTLFGNDDEQILDHLREHARASLNNKIRVKPSITKYRYNWKSLAFIPRAAPSSLGDRVRGAGS